MKSDRGIELRKWTVDLDLMLLLSPCHNRFINSMRIDFKLGLLCIRLAEKLLIDDSALKIDKGLTFFQLIFALYVILLV